MVLVYMLKWLGYIDGIHGTPYIAAPWIRHGLWNMLKPDRIIFRYPWHIPRDGEIPSKLPTRKNVGYLRIFHPWSPQKKQVLGGELATNPVCRLVHPGFVHGISRANPLPFYLTYLRFGGRSPPIRKTHGFVSIHHHPFLIINYPSLTIINHPLTIH